jgi:hypothetical protein
MYRKRREQNHDTDKKVFKHLQEHFLFFFRTTYGNGVPENCGVDIIKMLLGMQLFLTNNTNPHSRIDRKAVEVQINSPLEVEIRIS